MTEKPGVGEPPQGDAAAPHPLVMLKALAAKQRWGRKVCERLT